MPKLKGNILAARLAGLEELFGEQGKQAVLAELSEADRSILEGQILPGSWYDNRLMLELLAATDRQLDKGDEDVLGRLGYLGAAVQLQGVYDSFVRKGRPEFLLQRCPTIWQLTHDFGRLKIKVREQEKRCRFRFEEIDELTVRGLVGWIRKGLELSGCTRVRCRYEPVRSRGRLHFEMSCTWQ